MAAGLTQQSAAERSDLSIGVVNQAERLGAVSVPSLVALAKVYGLSLDALLLA